MNFAYWVGNRKHCLQLYLFQGNQSWWWVLSCPRKKIFSITSFSNHYTQNYFLLESLCFYSIPDCLFDLRLCSSKPLFNSFVKIFLLKPASPIPASPYWLCSILVFDLQPSFFFFFFFFFSYSRYRIIHWNMNVYL